MLSLDTQQRIKNLMLFAIERLSHIDNIKRELNASNNFDLAVIFNSIDSSCKGYIDSHDITTYLYANNINATSRDVNVFISYFDHNADGVLSYDEFIYVMYAYEMRNFSHNFNFKQHEHPLLPVDIQQHLQTLMHTHIHFIQQLTTLIERIKSKTDFNIHKLLSTIKHSHTAFTSTNISKNDIDSYITNKLRLTSQLHNNESDLLFTWLNVSKTGTITLTDLHVIFQQRISNTTSSTPISLYKQPTPTLTPTFNATHIASLLLRSFFELLYTTEQTLEHMKIRLSQRNDFNVDDAFTFFEEHPFTKNVLTERDVHFGLRKLSIYPTHNEIDLLIKRYSLMKEKHLNYSDFFNMLVPYMKTYRNVIACKRGNSFEKGNIFLCETLKNMGDVLEKAIVLENKIELLRRKIRSSYMINLKEFVNGVDKGKKGFLNVNDVRRYYKDVIYSGSSGSGVGCDVYCDLVYLRLDRQRKGKITYEDIIYECKGM